MVSPFMPFISDYLYHKLSGTTLENGDSLMIMNFPKDIKKDENIENMFSIIEEAIISIRRAKTLIDMGNSKIEKANLAILLMRLEVHLIVISLMKQQVHFIDLFGWSFVIGELSTQKLLKSLL